MQVGDLALATLQVVVPIAHLFASPYTKVEESFSIQAIHDILEFGVFDISQYDHHEFAGAVPRSFIGPLLISAFAYPFKLLGVRALPLQLIVRGILGFYNSLCNIYFCTVARRYYGTPTATWTAIFLLSQFHLNYYLSRTLPNFFAYGIVTIATARLLPARTTLRYDSTAFALLTFSSIVFRNELALLTIIYALFSVSASPRITTKLALTGLATLLIGSCGSFLIDSYFWDTWILPEAFSFWFNVVQGRSSDWGVVPFYAYFALYLPKLILNPFALFCLVFAIFSTSLIWTILALVGPLALFVLVMSFLGHKEWRFIVYILPSLTLACGIGASYIWERRRKLPLLCSILVLSCIGTIILQCIMLLVSQFNYPGAHALNLLHERESETLGLVVWMDSSACMTGITRFLQSRPSWTYLKTEGARPEKFWAFVDTVLTSDPAQFVNWTTQADVLGYAGIQLIEFHHWYIPWIRLEPQITIMTPGIIPAE